MMAEAKEYCPSSTIFFEEFNLKEPRIDFYVKTTMVNDAAQVEIDIKKIETLFQKVAAVPLKDDDPNENKTFSADPFINASIKYASPEEHIVSDDWLTVPSVIQRGFANFQGMSPDLFIDQCASLLSKKFLSENAEAPLFKRALHCLWKDIESNREKTPKALNHCFIKGMISRCIKEAKEEIRQLAVESKRSNVSEGIRGSVYALALYEWINNYQSYPEEAMEDLIQYEDTFILYGNEDCPRRRNFTLAMIKLKQLVPEPKQSAALIACTLLEGSLDLTHFHCYSGGHLSGEIKFRIATYQAIIQPRRRKRRTPSVHPKRKQTVH
jgi:hypothetical protein